MPTLIVLPAPSCIIVDSVRFEHDARWRVLHESPHHPRHWRKRVSKALERVGDDATLLHARSADDRWWLVPTATTR